MKVIVFGATGLAGKQIIKELLNLKAEVAAFIRNTDHEFQHMKVITGALDDSEKISSVIKDYDVIISAVGNRDYEDPTQVVTPFVKLISEYIQSHQRFIVLAGSGLTLFSYNKLRRNLPGQPEFLKNQRADHWDAYCYLAPLDINNLFVCPTMIVPGDADGSYYYKETYFPQSESRQVSAGNVGHFIAGEIMTPKFKNLRIGLVNI